ncbi:nucleotide pyrophosphohydrolase [Pengzhenrongella sicca]|uniref:Nucleotide pyrophosphohydrolase n=1 Tax=Pengzhenrongella sicca TaxID=2819238 RepID=A0A8A4ZCF7_9MICO|nr:nucleotide pyrophosphohydrolase [Pengzhenrongella sicca]QTE29564.1 nucleotide pyrophosphohydrolase [Pengzhenrongella sicca]
MDRDPQTPTAEPELAELTRLVREFSAERDWEQFHDPKSLILALMGEVGELAELFQWIPADGAVSRFADPARRQRAGEEIADVLVYLLRLADVLGVDIAGATRAKLADSHRRFAVDQVLGTAPEKA